MKKTFIAVLCVIALMLTSCSEKYVIRTIFAMDTVIDYKVFDTDAAILDRLEEITKDYDSMLSAENADSEVYKFNNSENGFDFSNDCAEICKIANEISENTDGAFDITVYPLTKLWNIAHSDDNWIPPTEEEIRNILGYVGYKNLEQNGSKTVKNNKNVQIDLGGIGKGYSLGKIAAYLNESKKSAIISFGGSVAAVGKKPDGEKWNIAVKNPFDTSKTYGTLKIDGGIISVSGSYERFAEYNGKEYHHIIDTKTGKPANTDLVSVLVLTKEYSPKSGAISDALSTALFVMGSDESMEFYEKGLYDFEALLIKGDGTVICTDGIKDAYSK